MGFSKKASNSRDLKVLNRITVLNAIRTKGPIARHEVAKFVGLTPPAVTGIVNDLNQAGVVREIGRGDSTGGRRPVMLELNPRAAFILAIRIQRGEIVAALLDLGNHIVESLRRKMDTNEPDDVAGVIGVLFQDMLVNSQIAREKVLWCGVASPGLVNSYEGVVERSSNLRWGKVPFAKLVSQSLGGIPVHVENISNAAALGEKVYGSGYGCRDMIYLNLSVGIGAGIIINNQLFGGAQGYAGEIGSSIIPYLNDKQDEVGYCTLESVCGIQAVLQRIKSVIPNEIFLELGLSKHRISWEDILKPPFSDLPEVRKMLIYASSTIGMKVAEMVHLFNPKMVILGGEWAAVGELLLDVIRKTVEQNTLKEMNESVKIILSTMHEEPALMGVYALVLQKLFQTEEWTRKRELI